jgi:Mobilization protein NikA
MARKVRGGSSSSGSESRKRAAILQARFTEGEAATIRARADRAGTSVGSLIRSAVLSAEPPRATRRPSVNHQAVARMLGGLGRVAEAFRQAAKVADHGKSHALIDAASRDLSELRTVCFEALGREP